MGFARRKHRDWFNENDTAAVQLRNGLHLVHLDYVNDKTSTSKKDSGYRHLRQMAQFMLRNMKDRCWLERAEELQAAADRHDVKKFNDCLRVVYGPFSKGSTSLYSADGELLIRNQDRMLARWVEHFKDTLNRESVLSDHTIS